MADKYNDLINERSVLDHTTLNITLKELVAKKEERLVAEIKRILEDNKLPVAEPKPGQTGYARNIYIIDLSTEDINDIIDIFFDLEEQFITEEGEATPTAAFYAALADKWSNLL